MKKSVNKDIKKSGRKAREKKGTFRKLLVALIATGLVFAIGLYAEKEYVNSDVDTEVVVTKANVGVNTYITENNIKDYFEVKRVRNSNLPKNAVTNANDVVNKYIAREYTENEVLSLDFVKDFTDEYTEAIKDRVFVSASVGALESAVSGQIKEGDYVDITVFGTDSLTKELYIVRKYHNIRVVEAFSLDGTSNEEQTTLLFTFLIDASDEDKLSLDLKGRGIRISKVETKGGSYSVIDY